MVATDFRYSSARSEKARIGVSISRTLITILNLATIIALVGGAVLVATGYPIGWALIGVAAIPAMIVEWKKGELKELIPSKKDETIDDVLDADVLGLLPRNPSPYDIATAVGQVYGGHFFASRFGVGVGFLQELASKETADTASIWQEARTLQSELNNPTITAGMLVVSLVKNHPKHAALLGHLQLTLEELIEGVKWQLHLSEIVQEYRKPKRDGGIARDWSFGWIPTLSRFGQNLSMYGAVSRVELEAHSEVIDQLIEILSKKRHRNVALVGPTGAGKTEIVQVLASVLLDAKALIPKQLKFQQVFMLDAASLISAAPGRGELEGLITHLLNEAYRAKNIIVCLDNAQMFFEEGVGSVDIANILLPILDAGRLRMLLTIDEQRYLKIAERNPELANSLNRISILPATKEETMRVMQDQLMSLEFSHHVTYMHQALHEAYRLSERYIHDLAMPGRALKLLESAANHADEGFVTALSVQKAIEQTMHVKVSNANSDDERDKLLHMEDLIHERMINQTRAVSVVSDALRRARSGVRNQNRPIGTFLFLGPTGVGKTELAKALAEVYFDGEDHIIRLDMNEYVRDSDVERLIADGANNSGSLTSQVMKQPFSVVLMDEIEKAHPSVLTTFLQVLDEGILRDIKGKEISFRDTIIIATSNAGADRIREHVSRGIDPVKFEDQLIDELIESNQFRPEFLNRFDEIVMFQPLGKKELLSVVDLILQSVNKTLALQKISVSVTDDAKEYLVDAGYDPRLGARPMRRVVQKAVENTVAKRLLSGEVEAGEELTINREDVEKVLGSKLEAEAILDETA